LIRIQGLPIVVEADEPIKPLKVSRRKRPYVSPIENMDDDEPETPPKRTKTEPEPVQETKPIQETKPVQETKPTKPVPKKIAPKVKKTRNSYPSWMRKTRRNRKVPERFGQ
jgi:hypothetical protein